MPACWYLLPAESVTVMLRSWLGLGVGNDNVVACRHRSSGRHDDRRAKFDRGCADIADVGQAAACNGTLSPARSSLLAWLRLPKAKSEFARCIMPS